MASWPTYHGGFFVAISNTVHPILLKWKGHSSINVTNKITALTVCTNSSKDTQWCCTVFPGFPCYIRYTTTSHTIGLNVTAKISKRRSNLPYVRLGAVTFLLDDLRCHPVRSTSHRPKYQKIWSPVSCHVQTELLGATEVNQLDHAILHQHYVATLYVSET